MTYSDPTDPFPETIFGGLSTASVLLNWERYAMDPSFSGQVPVIPRDRASQPSWSIYDSDESLTVVSGPGEFPVNPPSSHAASEVVARPTSPPTVPIPVLAKYLTLETVELADTESQASGQVSAKSTSVTNNVRTVTKVSVSD